MSTTTQSKILPRLNLALYILFILFAAGRLWSTLVDMNKETEAVNPAESPHVEVLYEYYEYSQTLFRITGGLSMLTGAFAAVLAFGLRPRAARVGVLALFPVYLAATGFSFINIIGLIPAGIALFLIYTIFETVVAPDGEILGHCRRFYQSVRSTGPRGILRFLAGIIIVFAAAGSLILLAEAFGFTKNFVGRLFSQDDFYRYLLFCATSGALACTLLSLTAILPSVFVLLASRLAVFRKNNSLHVIFLLIPQVWFALLAGGIFFGIVFATFHAEILDLGLYRPVIVLSFLAGYLLLVTTHINFKFILKRIPDCSYGRYSAGDYAAYLVISMMALPLLPAALMGRLIPRKLRLPVPVVLLVGLVSAGLLLFIAGGLNYPMLTEYSYAVQSLYSIVMIGVAVCTLFMLVRFSGRKRSTRSRTWITAAIVLLSAALISFEISNKSMQMRLIINEYAPIGRTIRMLTSSPWGGLLGRDEMLDGEFAPYGDRHKTLPENPGLDFGDAPPPIIYILLDAVRPDRMNLDSAESENNDYCIYKYKRRTTPVLEKFAKEAVVFTNARSTSSATSCAMKNIFSGCYSTRSMTDIHTPDKFFTNELLDAGYERFFLNHFADDRNGISAKAFTRSIKQEHRRRFEGIVPYGARRKNEDILEKIADYEQETRHLPRNRQGYFVYLHYCAAHFPWKHFNHSNDYEGAANFGESQDDLYDETVNYLDIAMGKLFEGLKKLGVYDRAIIIITADHGTGLNDHGKYAGFFSYEEQIRVPFLIKIPGVRPRTIDVPITSHDLAPTLVNLFRRGVPNRFDGISLLPVLSGKETSIDREFIVNICAFHDAFALIRNNRWKLIYHRDRGYHMLYDLKNDPRERRNLSDKMPGKCNELIKVLERFLWQGRDTYANPCYYE